MSKGKRVLMPVTLTVEMLPETVAECIDNASDASVREVIIELDRARMDVGFTVGVVEALIKELVASLKGESVEQKVQWLSGISGELAKAMRK